MKQQPDKFFREKLGDYARPAPAAAWDRIEASIEKRTAHTFEWWKIAAAVLLLTSVGYFVWNRSTTSYLQPLAKDLVSQQELDQNQPQKTNPVLNSEASEKADQNRARITIPDPIAKRNQPTTIPEKQKSVPTPDAETKTFPLLEEAAPAIKATPSAPENSVAADNANSHTVVAPKPTSRTLKFSVEETNQYLDKKAIAQATSDEKKSSTFKKLLQKAGDLKTNQDPFGDLREMKNEILALNFKNEKRGQNK